MIKLPSRDASTIPWMSKREIPTIRAILSAWRSRRKNPEFAREARDIAMRMRPIDMQRNASSHAHVVAMDLEIITAIDEILRSGNE